MKKIVALLLASILLLSLCACGAAEKEAEAPAPEAAEEAAAPDETGTDAPETAEKAGEPVATSLTFGVPGPIGTYLYGNNASSCDQLIFLVFDPIVYTDPVTYEYTSDIADFSYQDDYTLVMKIKDGVTFTNGEPLTGEDLLFTIQSEVSAERASRNASKLAIFNLEKSYVGDDGMTVYLVTDDVEATALANLAVPVLCKSWVEENGWDGEAWYYSPNGTGPYTVKENVTGVSSTVVQKPEVAEGTYWNQDFHSDILEFTGIHYDDKSVMFIDAENGDIDMAFQIDSVDYARIENEGIDTITGVLLPYDDVQMLTFDIDDGPTMDENLRAAIAYGVNWDDVAIAAWEDYGKPATSILASTMGDMYRNVGQYEYDPELAKEYADKVTGSKEVEICIFTDNLYVQECEVIRAYLEQIGISLTTTVTDMATFFAGTSAGDGDLHFSRYPNGNSAHEPYLALGNFEPTSTLPNMNLQSDAEICQLLADARHTLDTSKRAELYGEVQQYMKDHFYAVPIAEVYGAYVYNNTRWAGADIISPNAANLRFVYCLYQ